jgi:hypothetical protein
MSNEGRTTLAQGEDWSVFCKDDDDLYVYLDVPAKGIRELRWPPDKVTRETSRLVLLLPHALRAALMEVGLLRRSEKYVNWDRMYSHMNYIILSLVRAGRAGRSVQSLSDMGRVPSVDYTIRACADLENDEAVEVVEGSLLDDARSVRVRWKDQTR